MAKLDWRPVRGRGAGANDLGDGETPVLLGDRNAVATLTPAHPMDQEPARKLLRQLLQWYFYERDRQSANRLEMAIDHDFYDNLQWDEEDAATLADRKQVPLVYNEVAPMCDWIIGTERRNRVDWKVLPRTEDDVQMASTKTDVLKYVSDVNRVPFGRSRAFADAVKGGLGWIDDGVRDDPTKESVYSKYENWRNVLHDSAAEELDGSDGRYLFRWRWVDEDIAVMMFPDRADRIRSTAEDFSQHVDPLSDEDTWTTAHDEAQGQVRSGALYAISSGFSADAQRRRVKLIECQYRMPVKVKIVTDGPFKGAFFDPRDTNMAASLANRSGSIIDKVVMRMHFAVFTEGDMLAYGTSIFRHNDFSLTPIWCYRRGRDRMPYGVIRRVRDVQRDLNKRASKALWLMNTNQLIMDEGAVDDIETAREEAQMPDGVLVKNAGKQLEIRRDTDAATGQLQMMTMDAQAIQKSGGVSQENMGRPSNAVSGEAIKARQTQGSVVTTEPFDNMRLAVQCSGSKQLSLVEQFFTEEKVIRLTGAKGKLNWVRINVPEQQPDGSVRYINDMTASMADFVVSEQDYAGTLRQVMFDSMSNISSRLPPEVALRVLTLAYEFSDLPNKDEIAAQFRKMTGDRDPNEPMSPEEEQAAQQQQAQQMEAMQMQREMAMAALEEARAKVREVNARATELEAKAATMGLGGDPMAAQREVENAVRAVQEQAAQQIEEMSRKLVAVQNDNSHKVLSVKQDADTKIEIARINAEAGVQVAEIQRASEDRLAAVLKRMEDIARQVDEVSGVAQEATKEAKAAAKVQATPAPAPVAAPVAPPAPAAPAQPVVVSVQPTPASKIKLQFGADGVVSGATIERSDGTKADVSVDGGKPNKGPK
ncbi:MAG: hypothetical protein KA784_00160 [Aquabacterium sp.]|nr:hypothetical protein [Aquabacterium sp.]